MYHSYLIYELWRRDRPGGGEGLWHYLKERADYDLAAAFSKLFWPDFVEVAGHVILKEKHDPSVFAEWHRTFRNNRQALESFVSHTRVYDLFYQGSQFPNLPDDLTFPTELYEYIARILLVCWQHALEEDADYLLFRELPLLHLRVLPSCSSYFTGELSLLLDQIHGARSLTITFGTQQF